VTEWKDGGEEEVTNGSKGSSSSSSSRRWDVRREELGVRERGWREGDWSAMSGAAMARFEVALGELCAQRSGEGVSVRRYEPGTDEAAESGRWIGLNSDAFALSKRGDERGEAGRLAVYCAWVCVDWICERIGEEEGE
jgi:hypothetical protein